MPNEPLKVLSRILEDHHKLLVALFFGAYLVLGLVVCQDYGVPWDDPRQREIGLLNCQYIEGTNQKLLSFKDKYYGPWFEMALVSVEKLARFDTSRKSYLSRHLMTFLLFFIGLIFFYFLCQERFKSWKVGMLGVACLVLSPRIFADSFYNTKDIPFLTLFVISMVTLTRYLNKRTAFTISCHGIVCGLLTGIRVPGIIVPVITVISLGVLHLSDRQTTEHRQSHWLRDSLLFGFFVIVVTVGVWPVLWKNPVYHFLQAVSTMSRYAWPHEVLYLGEFIKASHLPWHYIPVWMAITIPFFYIILFFSGVVQSVMTLVRGPLGSLNQTKQDLIIDLLWFFLPLILVIVGHSVVYDGWRHLFFIYPAFILLALRGLQALYQGGIRLVDAKIIRGLFGLVVLISLAGTARFMIANHPYQNVYFNWLAGTDKMGVRPQFELDYWGLSYRQALEYILKQDDSDLISVKVANPPGKFNALILPMAERNRLRFVEDLSQGKYFLSNFRYHPGDYPYPNEFYSIQVDGRKIMVVYKIQ
jgi:hypothetical protein